MSAELLQLNFTAEDEVTASAVMHSSVGVAISSLAGSLQYANSVFLRFFDADPEHYVGADVRRMTGGCLHEDLLAACARDDAPRQIYVPLNTPDGPRMLLCTLKRVLHGSIPMYVSLIVYDITEVAAEIRERVQVFRRMLGEQGMQGVWNWTMPISAEHLGGNPMTWMSATENLFGTRPVPKTFDDFLRWMMPSCRARVVETLEHAIRTRQPYSIEYQLMASDGSVRHMRSCGHCIEATPTSRPRLVAVEVEVELDERHRSRTRERHDTLVDHLEIPVAFIDRRLRYRYFNPEYVSLASRTWGTVPQLDQSILSSSTDPARIRPFAGALQRALEGRLSVVESTVPGEREEICEWTDLHLTPIRDETNAIKGAIVVGIDVTRIKHAELRRQHLKAELEQRLERRAANIDAAHLDLCNRVAAMCDELASELAHVKALVETHRTDERSQRAREALARIEPQLQGLARVAAASLGVPKRRPIDMTRLVKSL